MSNIQKYQQFIPATQVKLDLPPRPPNTRSLFDLLQGVGICKWDVSNKQYRPFHQYGIDADTIWIVYVEAAKAAARALGKPIYMGNHGKSYVTPYFSDPDFEDMWNSGAIQAEVHTRLEKIWNASASSKAGSAVKEFSAIQPNN